MKFTCKTCGYEMSTQECLEDPSAILHEGDLSICLNCASVYELRAGVLCLLSDEAIAKLSPDVRGELEMIQISIRAIVTEDLAFNQNLRQK